MPNPTLRALLLRTLVTGCSVAIVAAACSHAPPAVQPRAPLHRFDMDSVASLCLHGDTTHVELLNRNTGARMDERWVISPHGDVVDAASGRVVMDSLEAERFSYRALIDEQRALVAKMTEIAAKAGQPVPPDPNCHEG